MTITSINPATDEVLEELEETSPAQVDQILAQVRRRSMIGGSADSGPILIHMYPAHAEALSAQLFGDGVRTKSDRSFVPQAGSTRASCAKIGRSLPRSIAARFCAARLVLAR